MLGQMPGPIGSIALVAALLLCGTEAAVPTNTARADDCLAEPNSPAPAGSHWFYHLDRANQRKCWYVRAPDQPAQQAAAQTTSDAPTTHAIPSEKPATTSVGAPMSISPSDSPPPWPHIKTLSVKPQPAPSATADEPAQQNPQQANTASSIPATPALQASPWSQISVQPSEPTPAAGSAPQASSMSEISAQTPEPTPGAGFSAPQTSPMSQIGAQADPDPPVAAVKAPEPSAVPSDSQTESVQPAANADVPDDAESTTQGHVSTAETAGTMGFLTPTTPVEMFPVLAVGLVVAGFLFRVAINIAAAHRRRRIMFDRSEPDGIDDRIERELRDEVREWDELIHELPRQPIAAVSDYSSSRPFGTDDEWPDNAGDSDQRDSHITDTIRKREHMLEQLKRDLDRLMRAPKVA